MSYQTPRDELLLAILVAVVGTEIGTFGPPLAVTALLIGGGSYLLVAIFGIGDDD